MRNLAASVAVLAGLAPQGPGAETGLSDDGFAYVSGAILSIFCHELGHALIDTIDLPLYGPEEDAADTLAAVLTHEIWDEEGARQNAGAFALSWLASAAESAEDDAEPGDFADVHAMDLQRHYRHVCLFYGADPEGRADFAADFELPEERAEGCAGEYARADRAWGAVLRDLADAEGGGLRWSGPAGDEIAGVLQQEVADLNRVFTVPLAITVSVGTCGTINAFYDPQDRSIVICQEFIDHLAVQAEEMEL